MKNLLDVYFVTGLLSKDEEVKEIPFTLTPDYARGSAELEVVMHSILAGECVMWDSTSFLGFITPVPPIEGLVVIGCGFNCSDTTRQVFLVVNLVDRILIQASQAPGRCSCTCLSIDDGLRFLFPRSCDGTGNEREDESLGSQSREVALHDDSL